jgi:hypothetical protein
VPGKELLEGAAVPGADLLEQALGFRRIRRELVHNASLEYLPANGGAH